MNDAAIILSTDTMNTAATGIYVSNSQSVKLFGNQVSINLSSSYTADGILLSNIPSFDVERNKIYTANSGYANGIYLTGCKGSNTAHNAVINNFVEIGGTSQSAGISFQNSSGINFYQNTTKLVNTSPSSSTLNGYNSNNHEHKK